MRLAMVKFVVPFQFVLDRMLILIGSPLAIADDVSTATIAVWQLAAA